MNIQMKYVLLLATFALAEKQIKLEDIERDNLISERRVNRDEENPPNQNINAPLNVGSQYEASSESADNDLGEDIVYAQAPSASGAQYGKIEQQPSIQYVTPQQFEKEYEAKPTSAAFTHPVHEATHTYAAPSRQSLISPIIYKPAASPSPYLSQQPKFVYVQAGPQQISQSGVITYGQPQHSAENVIQTEQKNAQDDVHYASIEQNHIAETSPQAANAPQHPITYARPLQYYSLLPQTSSIPNYVMVFRSPSHTQAYTIPSIQYSQQALVQSAEQQSSEQQHLTAPQPTEPASYVSQNTAGTAVLPAPEASPIPAATLQYALPQLQYATQQYATQQYGNQQYATQQYATQPLQLQPVEYVAAPHQLQTPQHQQQQQQQQQHHHHPQYYPSQHFTSPFDIYHSLQKHQPTSLLDSYIPSSVIYAAQRQRHAPFNRQILHAVPGNFASPALTHPTQYYHHGSHQPGYNTIAYSTAQGYSKRSPKLVTERPLKLNKRN